MDADQEILLVFLQESAENLDQLDQNLVELELRPSDPELLAQVFRTVHTIKGTTGFLGFQRLERLTHAGETLLGALRDGDLVLTADITTSLLAMVDAIRQILASIENDGTEGSGDYYQLITALQGFVQGRDDRTEPMPGSAQPDTTAAPPEPEGAATPSVAPAPSPVSADGASEVSLRVSVEVLDNLMDLISELIVVRSRLNDLAAEDEGSLAATCRQLDRLVSELQEGVMLSRLQPVGMVTSKFRRIARDLAAAVGKHVRVEISGENVGVDRAVNEALRDPMLHLVRNAIDHGIESPAEREALGKPTAGHVQIKAYHQHGRVHLEVADDGRGLDPQLLRSIAVENGLATAAAAEQLTDQEALSLAFLPGLSTKESVTKLSGRGVGMDIVRTNLQQIGGSVDISSVLGSGTVFKINVPLTLAIMPSLSVWCGGQRYAIPQVNVEEIVHMGRGDRSMEADDVDGRLIYRLRGHLLPSIELSEVLKLPPETTEEDRILVVLESEGRRFALAVAQVGDTADVVVKPLPSATRSIPVFMGVTILGDGRPSLILDIGGIAAGVGIAALPEAEFAEDELAEIADLATSGMLLASAPDGGKLAFDLSSVRRLELLAETDIEKVGERDVVQYRDSILPLVRVSQVLPERRESPRGSVRSVSDLVYAVVVDSSSGPVGMVVAGIDEIVPETQVLTQPTSRRGVRECRVIEGTVAEVLDIDTLVADAGWGGQQ